MKLANLPITPIVGLVIGKILGIIFTAVVFSLDIKPGDIFELMRTLFLSSNTVEDTVLLSSYSDLFMFTLVSTGVVLSLFAQTGKAYQRLNKLDLENYLRTGFKSFFSTSIKLYGQSVYWMMVLLLSNIFILYNALTGKTYLWIYLITLILTISLGLYFYYDFHREIQLSKNKLFKNEL